MGFKKLSEWPLWKTVQERICRHPEHQVPGMIMLACGVHVYTCPGCNKETIVTVPPRPTL